MKMTQKKSTIIRNKNLNSNIAKQILNKKQNFYQKEFKVIQKNFRNTHKEKLVKTTNKITRLIEDKNRLMNYINSYIVKRKNSNLINFGTNDVLIIYENIIGKLNIEELGFDGGTMELRERLKNYKTISPSMAEDMIKYQLSLIVLTR